MPEPAAATRPWVLPVLAIWCVALALWSFAGAGDRATWAFEVLPLAMVLGFTTLTENFAAFYLIAAVALLVAVGGTSWALAAEKDQGVRPEDIPRFAALGVMPNIQPLWARSEPSVTDVAVPICGPEIAKWIYPFRSLIDAGASCALSSDWGVSTLNPFHIMETAITRQPPEKGRAHPVFLPEQRMRLDECIKGYTTLAAAAAWRSADTGSLEQGKYADLIVLDRNLFEIDVYDIHRANVLLTVLAGRDVWRDPDFKG